MRLSRLLALLLAITLLAAACSDDTADTSTEPEAPETPEEDPGEEPADDTEPPVEEEGPTESDDPEGMTDPEDMGDDPSDQAAAYCALSAEASAADDGFDLATATPEELEAHYRRQLALVDDGLEVAPPLVADDLTVYRGVISELIDILSENAWDYTAALDQLSVLFSSDAVVAANAALQDFDVSGCGFEPEAPTPDEPVVSPEVDAYCTLAIATYESDLSPSGTAEANQEFYEFAVESSASLLALAPPEIADSLAVLDTATNEIASRFESEGWTGDAAYDLLEAYLGEPGVEDSLDAAASAVEAYDNDVCGLDF